MSTLDHMLEPEAATVRRLEVITGTGRRRRFSDGDKGRIIEETLAPGAVVSEVARRHGLSPQQLFGWRRQAWQLLETTVRVALLVLADRQSRLEVDWIIDPAKLALGCRVLSGALANSSANRFCTFGISRALHDLGHRAA